ncbi:MAG TPA: hypothetical protein DCM05_16570 [Elusimicrobia bacterium]|nr:hypothetical protein [Elusimicrobiota bacterium]
MKNLRAAMNAAQPPREGGVARRRFMVKLTAALLLLGLCLVAALPVFADPWTALQGGAGLDVRDDLNQPVSRAALERQVRDGSMAALRQGALGVLLDLLDRSGLLSEALRGRAPRAPEEDSVCVLRESKAPLKVPTVQAVPVSPAPVLLESQSAGASRRLLPVPLRC